MVVAGREQLHVLQEEDGSKRRQILDGARKVFMDLGFDGASMGEIARAAGVKTQVHEHLTGAVQNLAAFGTVLL